MSQVGLTSSSVPSESAVEAFQKTFSPCEHKRTASLAPSFSTTLSLPVELLLIIFKLVYEEEKFGFDLARSPRTILSSSRFPYAVAAVCSLWRDVMSLVPKFWIDVVVILDTRPAALLSAIQSQLSSSRKLLLDVTITRRDFDHAINPEHERMQIMSIMSILINPHLHRIRVLRFDVMFSSSLPPFHNGFRGTAGILEALSLRCREDNGNSADDWESFTPMEPQFLALDQVIIDGRSYYNACKADSHFAVKILDIGSLAISRYRPLPGESFLVSDFLHPITKLRALPSLEMTDLILEPSPLPLPPSSAPPSLTELRLRDVHDSRSVAEIIDTLKNTLDITIAHCAIGDIGPFHSDEGSLNLEDIDADQDLVALLHSWEGNYLTVKNCPGFDDTVLRAMTPRDGSHGCAPGMVQLTILDCEGFSVAALRELASTKLNVADGPRSNELVFEGITVFGRVPVISLEDYEWFDYNMDYFEYTRIANG